jgi:hypothetical protein
MRVATCVLVVSALCASACSRSGADRSSSEPGSRINQSSIEQAKALVMAPAPLADVRPKLVAVLGEPTAREGENLVWAGLTGDQCWELVLHVQGNEVKGTVSGSAHRMAKELHARCAARAGK